MPSYTTSNANDPNPNPLKWTPPANVERLGQKHSLAALTDCPSNSQHESNHKKIRWSHSTPIREHKKPTTHQPMIDLTNSDTTSPPKTPKYLSRRDKLLESIKLFVESLPFYLHQPAQDMALTLLTCADEFSRRKNTTNTLTQQENYIPLSARFNHSLTCSKLLSNDDVFTELHNNCNDAVHTMQQILRKNTILLQKRELYAAKLQLQFKYIHHGLTLTHMLLINTKLQPKNKFLNLTFTDGYLSKIAFLKYLQSDTQEITKYLDCSLHRLTLLLDHHTNYKQDPYDLFPYSIPRNIDNDEDPIFPNTSNYQQHTNTTHQSTNTSTPPTHSTPDTFDYDIQDSTPQNSSVRPPSPYENTHNTHDSTPQTNNQNNIHINLTTNHGDNITNNFSTPSPSTTTQLQKTTLLPTFQTAASILQNNNSAKQPPSQHQKSTNHPNTAQHNTSNMQKQPSTNSTTDTDTPNASNTHVSSNKTHPNVPNPYLKKPTPHHQPPHQNTNSTPTLHSRTLPNLNTITPHPQTPANPNERQPIHTTYHCHTPATNTHTSIPNDNGHPIKITAHDLSTNPPAAEITNEISETLKQIMPTLTYQLCLEVSSKRDEEAAANAALAWYRQQLTKSATKQVAQALQTEPKASPETLQTLINDSVNKAVEKKVASAQTKITKSIHQNLQKNSLGLPHHPQTTGRPHQTSESANPTNQTRSPHPRFTPTNPSRYLHNQSFNEPFNQRHHQSQHHHLNQRPYSPTTHTNYQNNRARKQHLHKQREYKRSYRR